MTSPPRWLFFKKGLLEQRNEHIYKDTTCDLDVLVIYDSVIPHLVVSIVLVVSTKSWEPPLGGLQDIYNPQ